MADKTVNYNLIKPTTEEFYDVAVQNGNMDIIDTKLKEVAEKANATKFDRKTYAELKALKDGNKLQEGKRYVLIDYRTKYKQPGTDVIKELAVEELLLTASSANTFEPIVFSFKYPQDTIWYNFNNDKCEDKTTLRNGFITRRHDSISGNSCPQDWRAMLWARWKPDANQYYKNGVLTNYSIWTSGNANTDVIYKSGNQLLIAKNTNIPSNATDNNIFRIIYNDTTIGMLISNSTEVFRNSSIRLMLKKGELHERLTFGDNCIENTIGEVDILHDNVFGSSCQDNNFGNACYRNTFDNNCKGNTFGNLCYTNLLGGNCCYNSFGNACTNNTTFLDFGINVLKSSCENNVFMNNCRGNTFGINFDSNVVHNDCTNNSFGVYCTGNIFGNSCTGNNFGDNCRYNTFGDNLNFLFVKALQSKNIMSLDIYNKTHTITVEKNNNNQYLYWYLNSNNQPIYTVIP